MWSFFTKKNYKLLKNINNELKINESLINKIKEIRKLIYNMDEVNNYEIIEYNIPKDKLDELLSTNWVMKNLDLNNLNYNISIKWTNNNINNIIYLKTNIKKSEFFIKRLPIYLKFCNYIQNNSNISIQLYLILTNYKKYIELNEIISPKHINSGYTHNIDKEICIWRKEEFEKVTFHELIHLFNKDHRNETCNFTNNNIFINNTKLNHESYFEAITDFKAIIYNIIYISLLTNKKIKFILKYEYNFINNQAKIIYDNLKNIKTQNTPAYSYFILKNYIFKYFIEDNYDINILNTILFENINYDKLINKIKGYSINDLNLEYVNFNSGRMTFFELK
jgi:hypothetical protein